MNQYDVWSKVDTVVCNTITCAVERSIGNVIDETVWHHVKNIIRINNNSMSIIDSAVEESLDA